MEGVCRNDKLLGEWTYYNNKGSIKKVIKADIKKELETEIKAEVQEQAKEHLEVKKAAAEKAAAEKAAAEKVVAEKTAKRTKHMILAGATLIIIFLVYWVRRSKSLGKK